MPWGGDRGEGGREKRGREVYGRREKRGREAGFPRWREVGEKGKNYATLRNSRNRKNAKGREPTNTGREPGLKGTGSGRFTPPCPSPHFACIVVIPRSKERKIPRRSRGLLRALCARGRILKNLYTKPSVSLIFRCPRSYIRDILCATFIRDRFAVFIRNVY